MKGSIRGSVIAVVLVLALALTIYKSISVAHQETTRRLHADAVLSRTNCEGLNTLREADYGEWAFILHFSPPRTQTELDQRLAFIADLRKRYALHPCGSDRAVSLPVISPGKVTPLPTTPAPLNAEVRSLQAQCGTGFTVTVARDGSVHGSCAGNP